MEQTRADEAYFSPGESILRKLRGLLGSARSSVDLCLFTVSDDRLTQGIIEAHQRGVTVRLITDNDKRHDEGSDIASDRKSTRLNSSHIPLSRMPSSA